MPHSCFCLSCFTGYIGPTGTDHNEKGLSVLFPLTKEKMFYPKTFRNLPLGFCFSGKTSAASSCFLRTSSEWLNKNTTWSLIPGKKERCLLKKIVSLDSPGVIQVHCYLWSCPTLCSPRCAWEMEGPHWPQRDASLVPGSVCTRGKSGCGCIPWRPGRLPVPVCGRAAREARCPRTACRC